MNDFKFVTEKFDIQNTSQYRLSIQVNRDGFSVLICDDESRLVQLQHFQTGSIKDSIEFIKNNQSSDIYRHLNYRKFVIIINSTDYTLIPERYFDEDQESFLLRNSISVKEKEKVISCKTWNQDTRVIFKLNKEFKSFTSLFKNSPEIRHIAAPLLSYAGKNAGAEKNYFIHSSGKVVHLLHMENRQLRFFNSFNAENAQEFVYHCINVHKRLGIDPNNEVHYSGELSSESSEIIILQKYLHNISFLPNPLPFEIAGQQNENYFQNLIEISACV